MDINKSLEMARKPGGQHCPECNEDLFSPIDKLSIGLFNKCCLHIKDDSHQEKNLFKLAEEI